MAVQHWTAGVFEASPEDTDSPAEGAAKIRETRETAGSLLDKEHKARDAGSVAAQGWHRAGSALVSVAATAPTTRPDGTTTLDADDKGRVWIDSDDDTVDYWDGTAFVDLKTYDIDVIYSSSAKTADYTVLDDDDNVFFVTAGAADKTITLPTAADNADRIITVKKVDDGAGTVIVDGEGAETIDGAATVVLIAQYDAWSGHCDGTSWSTLGSNIASVTFSNTLIGAQTQGSVYNALSPHIPNVGDYMLVCGYFYISTTGYLISGAYRYSSTTISLMVVRSTEYVGFHNCIEGSSSALTDCRIAW